MRPIVAIVGRPNVGKSTLFNRLVGERRAIVQDTPGVTRDRNYADTYYDDLPYTIVDTGGFEPEAETGVLAQMRRQAMIAVAEADVVVFVVDAREGLVPADEEVADLLRRSRKPLIIAVNKVDGPSQQALMADFYALGVEAIYPVSAAHGRGAPALVEAIVERLPRTPLPPEDPEVTRVALVGRPNVGKSTMTNRLLGEDRMIVDARAGTTRDAVDSALAIGDRRYVLVDTAGLRRSRGIDRESTEGLSVIRTLRAVERCHVAVLLLDATEGVTDQDARIAGHIEDKGRGLVIVLNKWDAVEKDPKTAKAFADQIELKMPFVQFAPVIFLSGLTGLRVPRLLEQVDRVRAAQRQRIATGPLNRWLEQCQRRHAPPVAGIRRVRLYFATQVAVEPPTIMISCNHPDNVHFSYKRYLINQFREAFDVVGTPVRIVFRARGESSGRANEDEEGVETEGDEEVALTADDEGDSEDVGVESDDEGVAEGDDGEEPEDDAADDADPEDAAADDDRA